MEYGTEEEMINRFKEKLMQARKELKNLYKSKNIDYEKIDLLENEIERIESELENI